MFFRLCVRAPRTRISAASTRGPGSAACGDRLARQAVERRRAVGIGFGRNGHREARQTKHDSDGGLRGGSPRWLSRLCSTRRISRAVGLELLRADAADAAPARRAMPALRAPSRPAWRRGRRRRPAGCARARPRRATPSAPRSARCAAASSGQRRRLVARRAPPPRAATSCRAAASRSARAAAAAPRRAARRARSSVSSSVLYSPSVCRWPSAISWRSTARHCASPTSAPMPKVLTALRGRAARPCRSPCRAARRSGGRRRSAGRRCWWKR